MKVFVCHYDKLVRRKQSIIEQLKKYNIEPEFISNYGKDNLTTEDKTKFGSNLSDSEISIFLHHRECYKKIIEYNVDYALILEDDALLYDNFFERLQTYMKSLPSDWDILAVGDGNINMPQHILNKYNGCNIFAKPNRDDKFKYPDAYLIRNKACRKIISCIYNTPTIINAVDVFLSKITYKIGLKYLFSIPQLSCQGSINNTFESFINHTNVIY
jgi:glycosyl transferase family 25